MTEEQLFHAAVAKPPAERAAFLDQACSGNAPLRAAVEALLAAHEAPGSLLNLPSNPPAANLPDSNLDATLDSGVTAEGEHAATGEHISSSDGARGTRPPQTATTDYRRDSMAGVVIGGRYTLQEKIGEGGMGEVWVAKQTEPVKRKVAVKLIRVERGQSRTILARFEAERQAIALMDHPHIAKLLDAGTTETGAPFFVMELVKGVPLNDFCDTHKLTIPERLNLFIQICSAVQHAHQKGIIHRDLKPSNILVESHDGKPVPKVIDFGLAKATTGLQLTDQSVFTAFGSVMGTPLYMAPEQATFNAVDVDTRADVYALGVVLYELLTGTTPITRDTLKKAALDEMLRLVREQEAPMPSSRLSSVDGAPSVAANRQIEPAKLGRFVKGELDWIVLKALSKDRDRRYETANGFARDIERFLNHEPVTAGPPSARYRFQKFVQRNRGQVIAASLVLLALVAGMAGTTVGLVRANRAVEAERLAQVEANQQAQKALAAAEEERKAKVREAERAEGERQAKLDAEAKKTEADTARVRAEAEKKRADEEKQIAQAVKDFLQTKLLAQADTTAQANQLLRAGGLAGDAKLNPTIRELLDRAARELAPDRIEANFPKQPLVQAEILQTVGGAYLGVGEAATAIPFLTRSLDLCKAQLGPDHPDTLNGMNNLAEGYRAAGKLDLALPLSEETLKLRKAMLGSDHPDTLTSMNNLATGYHAAGKLDQALPLYEETLKLRKAELGPDHDDTLTSMNNLAGGYQAAGKLDESLSLYEEALKLRKAKHGPEHPHTLTSINNLAVAYQNAGKRDKALPLFEETLKLRKAMLGSDHPDTLNSMNNLAGSYQDSGQLNKSLPLFEESVKLMKARLGPDHPDTLMIMNNLAAGYGEAGKLDLALPLLEETLKLTKAKLGPDHPETLRSMNNLAGGYRDAGKLDLALQLIEETLKLTKARLGPDHPHTLASMNNLAAGYWELEQLDKSVPLFEQLLPLQEKKLGRQHPDTQLTVANLGVNYKDAGRLKEAIPLLEEAYQALKKNPTEGWVALQLLNAYAQAGKTTEARKLIDVLLADARKQLPKDSPQLAGLLAQFGMRLLEMKGYAEAEPLLRECLAVREQKEPDAWTTFNTQSMLGGALLGQKKHADAEPLLLKGYEGMKAREKTIPPPAAARLPEALDRLIELYTASDKPDEVQKWQTERTKYPPAAASATENK